MTEEVTFYSDKAGRHITSSRAIFPPKTYAMANITSVSMGVIPANRMPGIVVAILGLLILVVAISFLRVCRAV